MAKLDFPGSPTPGAKYPSPAVPGLPVYTWDGEKWTSIASQYVPGTAPFDALAYSGMQVNGAMEVNQEYGTATVSVPSTKYITDGWMLGTNGTQVLAASQQANAPPGFSKSSYCVPTTANAAPAANDYCFFYHPIEGYRVGRLAWGTANAQSIALSFWIATSRAGMFSGSVRNVGATRTYPFTFPVYAVGTWEYKSVVIPGDTTGTWAKDNTAGMTVSIALMVGSGQAGPANAWAAAGYIGATGSVNGVASTSDYCYFTGVTVLPGTQAPTAAQSPNIVRPYGQDLEICKRYYQKIGGASSAEVLLQGHSGSAGAAISTTIVLSPFMRVVPTVTMQGFSGSNTSSINLNPGIASFGWQVIAAAAGFTSHVGGGFLCDARL